MDGPLSDESVIMQTDNARLVELVILWIEAQKIKDGLYQPPKSIKQ